MALQDFYIKKEPQPDRKLQQIAEILLHDEVCGTCKHDTDVLQSLVDEYNLPIKTDRLRKLTHLLVESHIVPSSFLKLSREGSSMPMYIRDWGREKLAGILRGMIDYGGFCLFT